MPARVPLFREHHSQRARTTSNDVIETALAHMDEDEVRRAYNRAKYWPQRIKLLQDWADLLDEFRKLSATCVTAA